MTTTDPTCDRTLLALPWLLNGSLEAEERRAVREHLIACPDCRAELVRTRELLAAFQAGRGVAAPARRRTAGQRAVLPLSWAAVIAAVLASLGGVWLLNERSRGESFAAKPQTVRPVASQPKPPPAPAPAAVIERPDEAISATTVETASPASSHPAPSLDQPTGLASAQRGLAAARLHKQVTTAQITPPAVPESVRISAINFESGSLGEWQ